MFEIEKYDLEFKEIITKSYLKTVSAFSNYSDGQIIFKIKDNSKVIGIEVSDDICLKLENMINDSIKPVPFYKIDTMSFKEKDIITLKIFKGKNTPYYYQGKAYGRSNTSTVEVDRLELNRLVIEGMNLNFESMKSTKQNLEFTIYNFRKSSYQYFRNRKISLDILRTQNLYDKDGFYNIAGNILSDQNDNENLGIDIKKFGKNINQILYRTTLNKTSILDQYYKAIEIFETNYQFEEIEGYKRVKKELIPREAFRESIANAMVYRVWDIEFPIRIAMYEDRIEITSTGTLPPGISKSEYLNGNISVLRNPILAGVFFRLNMIEKFGTGISRIVNEYRESITKPSFMISDNSIAITLPLIEKELINLSKDELLIYRILNNNVELSRSEIEKSTGYNKSKIIRIINKLTDRNIIRKVGRGPNTTYRRY